MKHWHKSHTDQYSDTNPKKGIVPLIWEYLCHYVDEMKLIHSSCLCKLGKSTDCDNLEHPGVHKLSIS